ncbi:MAG: hypothetical protein CMJ94_13565, partial [Planctomycetes bacterium]|nr:hypothetical protein [Planctomycetota bacterium]
MSEDWKQEFVLHEEAPAKIDATFLGKKEFGSRLVLKRKGQTQWVQYERIPLLAVLIFMIVFGIVLGLLLGYGGQLGLTPIFFAVWTGNATVVRELLAKGSDGRVRYEPIIKGLLIQALEDLSMF